MTDTADDAWTIAMATGSTPLPPHSAPLRHSEGGLNVAARHILLALYLHHRDLHLPDPQLPAPQAEAPTPEAWADPAPEEIAAYLPITCRRSNTALGRQKGTPYLLSALLYPAHPPHPTQLTPPEGWTSFQNAHLAASDEATATRMDPADQRAYVRGLEARLREAHRWHARSQSPPQGQGGSPSPTRTRPRRPRQTRGPTSAPASRACRPDQGPGQATARHPTPRAPEHTNSIPFTSAHHHHRTTAP